MNKINRAINQNEKRRVKHFQRKCGLLKNHTTSEIIMFIDIIKRAKDQVKNTFVEIITKRIIKQANFIIKHNKTKVNNNNYV